MPPTLSARIVFLAILLYAVSASAQPTAEDNLPDRDIYRMQYVDPLKPASGIYYPLKISKQTSQNDWKLWVQKKSAQALVADSFSVIFDYRVLGDSLIVVAARKIIKAVRTFPADTMITGLFYYFPKQPALNKELLVKEFYYYYFDDVGFIGVSQKTATGFTDYYIDIEGKQIFDKFGAVSLNGYKLEPAIKNGVFLASQQNGVVKNYICGQLLKGSAMLIQILKTRLSFVKSIPDDLLIAGTDNATKLYRVTTSASNVTLLDTLIFPHPSSDITIGRTTGKWIVIDHNDLKETPVVIPKGVKALDKVECMPYSSNIIITALDSNGHQEYWSTAKNDATDLRRIRKPGDGDITALASNYLFLHTVSGKAYIVSARDSLAFPVEIGKGEQIKFREYWNNGTKTKSFTNETLVFTVTEDDTTVISYSCFFKDNRLINTIKDSIYVSEVQARDNSKKFIPLFYIENKYLAYRKKNAEFWNLRDLNEKNGKGGLIVKQSDAIVYIEPFISYNDRRIAKVKKLGTTEYSDIISFGPKTVPLNKTLQKKSLMP